MDGAEDDEEDEEEEDVDDKSGREREKMTGKIKDRECSAQRKIQTRYKGLWILREVSYQSPSGSIRYKVKGQMGMRGDEIWSHCLPLSSTAP